MKAVQAIVTDVAEGGFMDANSSVDEDISNRTTFVLIRLTS